MPGEEPTPTTTRQALAGIYQQIPGASACKAGCTGCCGPVPWSAEELAQVAAEIPATAIWIEQHGARGLLDPATGKCPFVGPAGCGVYDRRPYMCRLFGSSSDPRLTCPYGSKAEEPLSPQAAAELTRRYRSVG